MTLKGKAGQMLHEAFEASLLVKALFALFETLSGVALWLMPPNEPVAAVQWLTRHELLEDPSDPLALLLLRLARDISGPQDHAYALYLLGHGVLKLLLVTLLWRGVVLAYPAAILALSGFVAYQMMRWNQTGAPGLLLLSAFDLAMIWLTWREWHLIMRR